MAETKSNITDASILFISLTDRSYRTEPISKDLLKQFLGGRGLGVKMLYDSLPPKTDSLSPENSLIFAVGPVTSMPVPTAGRLAIITKSPLTGTVVDSNVGGYIGNQIRRAGYLAIVFEGKANKPVYVWINDGAVEIRDATKVWGTEVSETTDILLKETSDNAQVACIGPSGENLVPLAAIMTDKHRAAGRGGVGTVMGSKNLKAVVVQGSGKIEAAEPEALSEVTKRARHLIKKNGVTSKSLPVYGTAVLVNVTNELGMLPTHNFQEGTFNDAEGVSGEKLLERLSIRTYNCYACPIGCGRISKIKEREVGGPEYETIWALGPQCGISDLEWVTEANDRCNELGMDTISVGSTIGCAMELAEKGNMKEQLKFGKTEGLLRIIEDMAHMRGIGADLAQGSKKLSEKYGAPELAMHVKGLEIPAYDPRGVQGHALGYATSNRGGCHLRSYLIGPEVLGSPVLVDRDKTEGKANLVILFQNLSAAMDSMVVCRFTNFAWTVDDYADIVSAGTGLDINGEELLKIGERIWTLERQFNKREGFTSKDDTLPSRFFEPLPEGGSRSRVVHLDEMKDEYYRLREYDDHGHPTDALLKRLELGT